MTHPQAPHLAAPLREAAPAQRTIETKSRIHTQAAAAHMTDEAWITHILEKHLTTQ